MQGELVFIVKDVECLLCTIQKHTYLQCVSPHTALVLIFTLSDAAVVYMLAKSG